MTPNAFSWSHIFLYSPTATPRDSFQVFHFLSHSSFSMPPRQHTSGHPLTDQGLPAHPFTPPKCRKQLFAELSLRPGRDSLVTLVERPSIFSNISGFHVSAASSFKDRKRFGRSGESCACMTRFCHWELSLYDTACGGTVDEIHEIDRFQLCPNFIVDMQEHTAVHTIMLAHSSNRTPPTLTMLYGLAGHCCTALKNLLGCAKIVRMHGRCLDQSPHASALRWKSVSALRPFGAAFPKFWCGIALIVV